MLIYIYRSPCVPIYPDKAWRCNARLCSGDGRCKSPPHVVTPPPLPPPLGGTPTYHPVPSVVDDLSVWGPYCGVFQPRSSQYAVKYINFWPIQQVSLHNCHIEKNGPLVIGCLSFQHPYKPLPLISSNSYRTLPSYFKDDMGGEGGPVGTDCSFWPWPCLLFHQSATLMLISPLAKVFWGVPSVESLLRDILFLFRASGLELVYLLQYHNYVPYVAVQKVNLDIGPIILTPHH